MGCLKIGPHLSLSLLRLSKRIGKKSQYQFCGPQSSLTSPAMSLLQVIATKGFRSGSSKAVAVTGRSGKGLRCANSRVTSTTHAGVRHASLTRPLTRTIAARYSTQPPSDQEQVWEDLNGIQDFYDPRFDSDYPEEEGMQSDLQNP